jgi:hypothetical protein
VPARGFIEARGGVVRTQAKARLRFCGGRVSHLSVGDEPIEAGMVIAAVPWFALADLLAEAPPALGPLVETVRRMRASPIVTVNLWLDREVVGGRLLGLPGRAFQWAFTALSGRAACRLSLVSSGAADIVALDREALVARALEELRGALPAMAGARVIHASAVRERSATFSLAPGEPERPPNATAIPNLLIAGDWTRTRLPATIESAVTSGHQAAALARHPA